MFVDIRYHLSSLVAVFLSLGLGIVIGMSLAEDATLQKEQQHLIRAIQTQVAAVQERNSELERELSELLNSLLGYEERLLDLGQRHFGSALQSLPVAILEWGGTETEAGVEVVADTLQAFGVEALRFLWEGGLADALEEGALRVASEELAQLLLGKADAALWERASMWGLLTPGEWRERTQPLAALIVVASAPEEWLTGVIARVQAEGIPAIVALPAGADAKAWQPMVEGEGEVVVVEGATDLLGRLNLLQTLAELGNAAEGSPEAKAPESAGGAE